MTNSPRYKRNIARLQLLWVATCALLTVGCTQRDVVCGDGVLNVALGSDVAGHFVVGGEHYGFVTNVAEYVAGECGLDLGVESDTSIDNLRKGLDNGTIDIAAIHTSDRVKLHKYPSAPLYATDYVLLMPSWARVDSELSAVEMCSGKRIATDRGFMYHTSSIQALCGAGAIVDTMAMDGHTLALRLLDGHYDAIVCERSEAKLVSYLYRNLRIVGTFDESVEVRLIFASRGLKERFVSLMSNYATSEDYTAATDLYFGEASVAKNFVQLTYKPTRVVGGISVWDKKIRSTAERVGVDWRLMSAMARYESGFRNDQVSNMGAVGLMQVTPIVATEFKMEEYDLTDPDTNILLAAKLLRKSSRALGFGNFPSTDDGVAIVVASYHCGITRTLEAQRLSIATGGCGKSWSDIAAVMTNMGDPEWNKANGSRMGRFADHRITIAYVNRVMEAYTDYRKAL